jgi:hypothetical protein
MQSDCKANLTDYLPLGDQKRGKIPWIYFVLSFAFIDCNFNSIFAKKLKLLSNFV